MIQHSPAAVEDQLYLHVGIGNNFNPNHNVSQEYNEIYHQQPVYQHQQPIQIQQQHPVYHHPPNHNILQNHADVAMSQYVMHSQEPNTPVNPASSIASPPMITMQQQHHLQQHQEHIKSTTNNSGNSLFNIPVLPSLSVGGGANESIRGMNRRHLVLLPQHTLVKRRLKSMSHNITPPSKTRRIQKPKSSTSDSARKTSNKRSASKHSSTPKGGQNSSNSSSSSNISGTSSRGDDSAATEVLTTAEIIALRSVISGGSESESESAACDMNIAVDQEAAKTHMDLYGE